jgi:chromosome segregation ATPase
VAHELKEAREAAAAAAARLEARCESLARQAEAAEAAGAASREKLAAVEAERPGLTRRSEQLEQQLAAVRVAHAAVVEEGRASAEATRSIEGKLAAAREEALAAAAEREREWVAQRDGLREEAAAERLRLSGELAAALERADTMEKRAQASDAAASAAMAEAVDERCKEREWLERTRDLERQRDEAIRSGTRATEELEAASAEARGARERGAALYVRSTVLEQQLAVASQLGSIGTLGSDELQALASPAPATPAAAAAAVGSARQARVADSVKERCLTVEEALEGFGALEAKWSPAARRGS